MEVLENSVSFNKTLPLFQLNFHTSRQRVFSYIIIMAKNSQLVFPSVLGFNIHQKCFAWCQKMESRLEKMEVLANSVSFNKTLPLFQFQFHTSRQRVVFLYNHYGKVQSTVSLHLYWALIFIKSALLGVKRWRGDWRRWRYLKIQYHLIKHCHFFSFTFTPRDSVFFFLYNHYGKVQSIVFPSVLGFNIHQKCFAWCQKMESRLEKMEVLENSVSFNKTLPLFQFYFHTSRQRVFSYIIIMAKNSQLVFPSVLGFNIHQKCFAWCQKMERRLEKMKVLANSVSVQ